MAASVALPARNERRLVTGLDGMVLPSDAICAAAYEGHTLTHDATSAVEGRHRAGEKSPPDSGDLRGYPDRVPPSPARPGLIDRHDLVAAEDHAAEKKMTIISGPPAAEDLR